MLDHPNSISNNLVKRPFLGPVNPNPVSYTSISAIEISVSESINHAALYTSNASGKLLYISESSRIVFTIYFFFLDVIVDELIIELNLLVLFSLFVVFP